MRSKSILYLVIKKNYIFHKFALITFKTTPFGSLQTSPCGSANSGKTPGTSFLERLLWNIYRASPSNFLIISSRDSNRFPFSVVIGLGKSSYLALYRWSLALIFYDFSAGCLMKSVFVIYAFQKLTKGLTNKNVSFETKKRACNYW